ncbi:MAG: ANTAR domain-containing protein [Pseudomonadota bacterium]
MSEKPLRIMVIDANRIRASIIEDGLREAGFADVTIIDETSEVMRRIIDMDPDVVFIDLENPSRDQLEHMFQVSRAIKRPVAMFVDRSDQAATESAIDAGVSAYIVDGLKKERVKTILDMAVSRFNAFDRLQRELEVTKTELEDRKRIDKAKAILMRTRGLAEPAAYALLRKTAMNQNRRIADIAESLIVASSLLDGEDNG